MHKLSLVVIGANFSPAAYQDAHGALVTMPPAPELALHEFRPGADGTLEHWMDGRLRATVPPEGLQGYADHWPQCAELAAMLKEADH
jgi:hypothetical protein